MTSSHLQAPSCEQIINIMPDPFVVIDREYRIIAANRSYKERYQVSGEDVVGRHCYEVSHHSESPCHHHGEHCPLEAVFTKGQPVQLIHVHYDKEDKPEYVQIQANPLLGATGEVMYMGEYINAIQAPDGEDPQLVGRSHAFRRMISLLQRVAPTSTTVLLLGESGVGKECMANYLHQYSRRSNGPFMIVDCASLDHNLIESELFGYEKGAFTGAAGRKKGLIEAANEGTLFIDEIGEMPLAAQTKLLRVLESGTIRRIGGTEYIRVNVRIVAATHRDLAALSRRKEFRQDLYYRLSAFPVEVPPLRDRVDDIPALAEHFIARMDDGDRHLPLAPYLIEQLLGYDYPGNVRELRNVVERAVILAGGDAMDVTHLVFEPNEAEAPMVKTGIGVERNLIHRRGARQSEQQILQALARHKGHRARTAHELGISERTLYRYVQKLRNQADESSVD